MRKINFSAGPSVLPDEVFEQMAKAMTDFEGSGLSIAEISHRSKEFMSVMGPGRKPGKRTPGSTRRLFGIVSPGRGQPPVPHGADEPSDKRRIRRLPRLRHMGLESIQRSRRNRQRQMRGFIQGKQLYVRPQRLRHSRRCRLFSLYVEQHDIRYTDKEIPRQSRTDGMRHVLGHFLPQDRRFQIRTHLRRGAEKHRPRRSPRWSS